MEVGGSHQISVKFEIALGASYGIASAAISIHVPE